MVYSFTAHTPSSLGTNGLSKACASTTHSFADTYACLRQTSSNAYKAQDPLVIKLALITIGSITGFLI